VSGFGRRGWSKRPSCSSTPSSALAARPQPSSAPSRREETPSRNRTGQAYDRPRAMGTGRDRSLQRTLALPAPPSSPAVAVPTNSDISRFVWAAQKPRASSIPQSLPTPEYSARAGTSQRPIPTLVCRAKVRGPRSRRYLDDWGRPSFDALASPQSLARSPLEGLPLVQ
jgi:hypothetical protein